MIYSNIDITDSERLSRLPFTPESTCTAGAYSMAPGDFLTLQLHCSSGDSGNAYLSGITVSADADGTARCTLTLSCGGSAVCSCSFKPSWYSSYTGYNDYTTLYLKDSAGLLRGFISMRRAACLKIYSACVAAGGNIALKEDAFSVCQGCIVRICGYSCRSIAINGTPTACNVIIAGSTGTVVDGNAGGFSISVAGTYSAPQAGGGISELNVNGTAYDIRNSDLLIKPTKLSNLRIITDDSGIHLTGVTDAE